MKFAAIIGILPVLCMETKAAVAAPFENADIAIRGVSDLMPNSIAQAPPAGTRTAQQSLCTQYAYASVNGYDLLNNLWGREAADSGNQCTYYYGTVSGGGISWGSSWTWRGNENNVKSYVYAGRQYDRPLLSRIRSLPTSVKWSYNKDNLRANVAYDLFTHPDKSHVNSNGEYELMIWLNRYGGIWPITESPTGSPIRTVTIGGHPWDLYFGYNGQMKVYSFLSAEGSINEFAGDILDFFKYLNLNHDFPLNNQYLLIDQFGSEAFTGTDAYFYVESFKADVNL